MKKLLLLPIMSLILISCATSTVEQDAAKDIYNKLDVLRDDVSTLDGKVSELTLKSEEEDTKLREEQKVANELINKKVADLESFVAVQKVLNNKIAESINENRVYMVGVNQDFENFRKSRIDSNSYYYLKAAAKHYQEKKYQKAHDIYIYYLKKPELLTQSEYRMVFYRTALIEYRLKRYSEAFVHFSQLYRNFHEKGDKYIASSLYHTGVILAREKKCSDAKLIFNQVINDYSNHKYFKNLSQKRINQISKWKSCREEQAL